MRERAGIEKRYRAALAAGLVVVVLLQAALFAWGSADADAERSERPTAQLVDLPENDAPLADIAEVLTPEPAEETAPRRADVLTMAAIPSIPKLSAAMANAVQPVMFMETLDEPDAEENPAVSYASVTHFVAPGSDQAQPLRPIDDRPAAILAMVGNRGRGIGAEGPHCLPGEGGRPRMFTRSQVVSGAPSILRSGL